MSGMDAGRPGDAVAGRNREPAPGDVDLDRVWLGVAAMVWRRQPGPLERLAGKLLRSPGLARALLTTPSLLLPWLIASAVVLAAGAAATIGSATGWCYSSAPSGSSPSMPRWDSLHRRCQGPRLGSLSAGWCR